MFPKIEPIPEETFARWGQAMSAWADALRDAAPLSAQPMADIARQPFANGREAGRVDE